MLTKKGDFYSLIAFIALQHDVAAMQYPDISFLLAPLNLMA
jgi:hypothetical protein